MKKYIKILILILMLIFITYKMLDVAAAYKSAVQIKQNSNITPWVIFINNTNITQEKNFSISEIRTINEDGEESQNVKNGKIAPGAIVELAMQINPTNIQRKNIKYRIIVELPNDEIGEFNVTEILINDNKNKISDNEYIGIITQEEINQNIMHNISIRVKWENNDNNNEIDTKLITSKEEKQIEFKVKVEVMQSEDN